MSVATGTRYDLGTSVPLKILCYVRGIRYWSMVIALWWVQEMLALFLFFSNHHCRVSTLFQQPPLQGFNREIPLAVGFALLERTQRPLPEASFHPCDISDKYYHECLVGRLPRFSILRPSTLETTVLLA